ncbi:hypothetical protein FNF27_07222 [Cafeteria roenbergensis]|uniref:Uncharacterized protein n=1 Tax=Cafeteria roenbergensis TaxID=33653 RepID=A0A5A8DCA5_CAFRO|nr:hypothetical protein FNF29_01894 [Cafeteria roenbergensis]KAA0161820.1 hypothetical protein FNF31_03605 [Cafeteria roenbergensis]KAA0166381.1 hypothetical protein FNF28_03150 [Cafeteria roenbergensis]KAA0167975.1 hypothetical protein FNF27_07222 [Cafeteria roenbergensis]|eukprot:KAA0155143.1 hypothetical protein FNF29_01894 [Cafeteria roenbergensis]
MFLATPHRGSQVAEFAEKLEAVPGLFRAAHALRTMRLGHPTLLDLNERFIDVVLASRGDSSVLHSRPQPPFDVGRILSLGEGLDWWLPAPAQSVRVVLPQSADPGIGAFEVVADADHITINKPGSPSSRLLAQTVHAALVTAMRSAPRAGVRDDERA